MPNTLTSIFVSNPATEPVEAPHPNTGFYVLGTQATVGGPWTVTHTLVNKTATPLTMVGRLKNFPAVTVSVVASGGPNNGNIFNNVPAAPIGTSATGTATGISVTASTSPNGLINRILASSAVGGPFVQVYQGGNSSYPHPLAAGTVQYYQYQYVGSGYYDDSPLSAVFSSTAASAAISTAYDGPLQFRPITSSTSYFSLFASNSRLALGTLTAAAGITVTARLYEGSYTDLTTFNAAVAALTEVEITSGFNFTVLLASVSSQVLTADLAYSYLAVQPLSASTPVAVVQRLRDILSAGLTDYADYAELDSLAEYRVMTNATSVVLNQEMAIDTTYLLGGVAVFDGSTLVTAAQPTAAGVVQATTINLPGTGTRMLRFVNSSQSRPNDTGVRHGSFLAHAGLQFNAGSTVQILHPVRQPNRLIIVSDSILSGTINDITANTSAYVAPRDSSIALLKGLLPTWEIYVFGYGNAAMTNSLGLPVQRQPLIDAANAIFAGAGKAVLYFQRGVNDYGGGQSPDLTGDAMGRISDAVYNRSNLVKVIHQSLFPSKFDNTLTGSYTAITFSAAIRAKFLANRPWVKTVEGAAITPSTYLGPDGLHHTVAGETVKANNLVTFLNTL